MSDDWLDQLEAGLVRLQDGYCVASDLEVAAAAAIQKLRAELAAARERRSETFEIAYYKARFRQAELRAEASQQERAGLHAERDALRELLLRWDALIKHQYSGSREAMSDMVECAQKTAQTLYGDPPWPTRIDAALNKGGGEK